MTTLLTRICSITLTWSGVMRPGGGGGGGGGGATAGHTGVGAATAVQRIHVLANKLIR